MADVINTDFPLSAFGIRIYQSISITIAALGAWGRPGWNIQTFGGKSKAEILDEKISKILLVVGFYLTFSSVHLVAT